MDKYDGNSPIVNDIKNFPTFECFYQKDSMGKIVTSNEREIEQMIRLGEQNVIRTNAEKNNVHAMLNQIQQEILYQAQLVNPTLASQYQQNPALLQQAAQQKLVTMQRQQMMNNQMMNNPMMNNQMMNNPMMNNPMMNNPMMNNQMMNNQMNKMANPMIAPNPSTNVAQMATMMMPTDSDYVPTFKQMQNMFQIFQTLQKMGVISVPVINEDAKEEETKNPIVLPTGEKLVPLGGGKYGLIKNKKN
jgi:hypothetical protein